MKKTLKTLSIVSFIILFLPFLQTCSNQKIIDNDFGRNSSNFFENFKNVANAFINPTQKDSIEEYQLSQIELNTKNEQAIQDFLQSQKRMTFNGYQLGIFGFETISYLILPYTLNLILLILLVIFAFKNKYKKLYIFGIINIIVLLIPLLILYFLKFITDLDQLKIGYYLIVINLLIITRLSYIESKNI